MKKPLVKLIPLLARCAAPTTAIASSLFAPVALGGPGDLDPAFADVGRLGPIRDLEGPAWSLESLDDGGMLLAGGDYELICGDAYCDSGPYGYEATNFIKRLSDSGAIDSSFDAARLEGIQVRYVVRQRDGKLVAVGHRAGGTNTLTSWLTVLRLQSDGQLDTTFGDDGMVELYIDYANRDQGAMSVILDPDDRIVVAGSLDAQMIVLRLLPNGSFDDSFGASGVFVDTERAFGAGLRILRTSGGDYRVVGDDGCQVVGLTRTGALDDAFGTGGIATAAPTQSSGSSCSWMVAGPDDRLLVAGSAGGQAFVSRLLADGAQDPGFSASAVGDAFTDATALALSDDGSVLVAGTGVSGASIMRLQANGELDFLFGNAGSTLIDLPSEFATSPVVHDMTVQPDGRVLAAGGVGKRPFVVRLLGMGDDDVPGVLGVTQSSSASTREGDTEAVVKVRRTGGESGSVSVAFQTIAHNFSTATGGEDYGEVSGRLTWGDGDMTEQEIRVPIVTNDPVEAIEYFRVMLSDTQGGAGLGARNALVRIEADGYPAGQFEIWQSHQVTEGQSAQLSVFRTYYETGAVSVTLTPVAGTATAGDDFAAEPVTLSWPDGDRSQKFVEFAIHDDTTQEGSESFTVELSDPTGGAVIGPGPQSSVVITIAASDQPLPPPPDPDPDPDPRGGGGGSTGLMSLLLLAAASLCRKARIAGRFTARN